MSIAHVVAHPLCLNYDGTPALTYFQQGSGDPFIYSLLEVRTSETKIDKYKLSVDNYDPCGIEKVEWEEGVFLRLMPVLFEYQNIVVRVVFTWTRNDKKKAAELYPDAFVNVYEADNRGCAICDDVFERLINHSLGHVPGALEKLAVSMPWKNHGGRVQITTKTRMYSSAYVMKKTDPYDLFQLLSVFKTMIDQYRRFY